MARAGDESEDIQRRLAIYAKLQHEAVVAYSTSWWAHRAAQEARKRAIEEKMTAEPGETQTPVKRAPRGSQWYIDFEEGEA